METNMLYDKSGDQNAIEHLLTVNLASSQHVGMSICILK
jgi:hypothetical protein